VAKVLTKKNSVSVEGVKKEKTKGEKFDVYIHTSNLLVTDLNTDDKWRIAKLEGKKANEKPKTVIEKKETITKETKVTKNQKKEVEK